MLFLADIEKSSAEDTLQREKYRKSKHQPEIRGSFVHMIAHTHTHVELTWPAAGVVVAGVAVLPREREEEMEN